jgi:hypothetical protein
MTPSVSEQRARDKALALDWHRRVKAVRGGDAVDGSAPNVVYTVTHVHAAWPAPAPRATTGWPATTGRRWTWR